jgi:hypothetical protein
MVDLREGEMAWGAGVVQLQLVMEMEERQLGSSQPRWSKSGAWAVGWLEGGSTCQPVSVAPERESYCSRLPPPHFSAFLLLKRDAGWARLCKWYEGGEGW